MTGDAAEAIPGAQTEREEDIPWTETLVAEAAPSAETEALLVTEAAETVLPTADAAQTDGTTAASADTARREETAGTAANGAGLPASRDGRDGTAESLAEAATGTTDAEQALSAAGPCPTDGAPLQTERDGAFPVGRETCLRRDGAEAARLAEIHPFTLSTNESPF